MNPIAHQLELQAAAMRVAGYAVTNQLKIVEIVTRSVFELPLAPINALNAIAEVEEDKPAKKRTATKRGTQRLNPTTQAKSKPSTKQAVKAKVGSKAKPKTSVSKPAPKTAVRPADQPRPNSTTSTASKPQMKQVAPNTKPTVSAKSMSSSTPAKTDAVSAVKSAKTIKGSQAKPSTGSENRTAPVRAGAPKAAAKPAKPAARRTRAPSKPPVMPTAPKKMDD